MTQEVYVDGIGNISIQGPVVTLSLVRSTQGNKSDTNKDDEVLKLTMTGQNLVRMTNILSNTLKRLAERNKNNPNDQSDLPDKKSNKSTNSTKKNKTVN